MAFSTTSLKKDDYETLKTEISYLKKTFDIINALFKSRSGAKAIVDLRQRHGIWKNRKAFRLKKNEPHELFTEDYYERFDRNPNIIVPGQIIDEGPDHIPFIDKEYFEEIDWPILKEWMETFAPLLNESDFTNLNFIQGNPFRKIMEGKPEDITNDVIDDAERIINDEDLLLKLCKKWHNTDKKPEMYKETREPDGRLRDIYKKLQKEIKDLLKQQFNPKNLIKIRDALSLLPFKNNSEKTKFMGKYALHWSQKNRAEAIGTSPSAYSRDKKR